MGGGSCPKGKIASAGKLDCHNTRLLASAHCELVSDGVVNLHKIPEIRSFSGFLGEAVSTAL